eukprot:m.106045 g.106045  ORF g.106045 m.106045 type:complete len:316 (+) comp51670_c0_seq1:93-1040(+)
MKITFKTLKQAIFTVDADPSQTIGQLKQAVEAAKGEEYYADGLKLIFSGKILNDAQTITETNIKETDFLVVMCGKPRAQPVPTPAAPAPVPAATPVAAAPQPVAAAPTPVAQAPAPSAAPSFPEAAITGIVEMGFPRDQVIAALRATGGNADLAIDVLMGGGFPSDAVGDFGGDFGGDDVEGGEDDESGLPEDSPLAELAQNPQFNQLRAVIQQNPELLPAILQQLAQSNPALVQLINENREDFQALLNAPVGAPAPSGGAPPAGTQIRVTQQEHEAIERLCAMGFDRNLVLQAYFACDKNEEMTANYLIENGGF